MVLADVFAVDFAEGPSARLLPVSSASLELPEMAGDPPVGVELQDALISSDTVWHAQIVRTEGTLDQDTLELFAIARIDDPYGSKIGSSAAANWPAGESIDRGQGLAGCGRAAAGGGPPVGSGDFGAGAGHTIRRSALSRCGRTRITSSLRDPTIPDGTLLSTTHIVYAPDGAKVEIIPEIRSLPRPRPALRLLRRISTHTPCAKVVGTLRVPVDSGQHSVCRPQQPHSVFQPHMQTDQHLPGTGSRESC